MAASDHLNEQQFKYHGSGNAYEPGFQLDDTHGAGLWLTDNPQVAAHYARNNAMGQREYFGNAEARPHVYKVSPGELEPKETGYKAKSATVAEEVPYVLPNGQKDDWDEYAKTTPPHVLED